MDTSHVNRLNKIRVLELIRQMGSASRADLAQRARLSAPTVTRIVDSLIRNEMLVVNVGAGSSKGGRPPSLVRFAADSRFIVGVDIGRTSIHAALANLDASVVEQTTCPTDAEEGFQAVMARVAGLVRALIANSRVQVRDIMGVGVAVGGLINRQRAIIESSPDFGWTEVDAVGVLEEQLQLPVRLDNVTRVTAIGEYHYGIGRRFRSFICVNVGYGVGAGIIVDGVPFYGSHGVGGEFGHTVVARDDPRVCNCGNRGCIEAIASGSGIARTARERIRAGEHSALREACGGDPERITAELVAQAAREGDALAGRVLREAVEVLGIGILNLVNLYDPEAIVLSGRVALAGDLVLSTIREILDSRAINPHKREIHVGLVAHGERAAVMGAIALILNEVLQLNLVHAEKGNAPGQSGWGRAGRASTQGPAMEVAGTVRESVRSSRTARGSKNREASRREERVVEVNRNGGRK
ncbi:MAG TPA: ROK family transcriptional regulator [Anaeromyxobacter sp.]|nr:ROK family transcriptional regulator [Anaeromyxobacter sp.]